MKEGKSALKKFARQFTIDGKPDYNRCTFFKAIKNLVSWILRDNRQTKMKTILVCKMQRRVAKTGGIDEADADFHSKDEINLEGIDENELFDEMIARIIENFANFQRRGSNWEFVAVNRLEIHLVD